MLLWFKITVQSIAIIKMQLPLNSDFEKCHLRVGCLFSHYVFEYDANLVKLIYVNSHKNYYNHNAVINIFPEEINKLFLIENTRKKIITFIVSCFMLYYLKLFFPGKNAQYINFKSLNNRLDQWHFHCVPHYYNELL